MNITENLIRIKEGKDNIIKSLKNKGVSINDNTLINEIPTIIDNAEIGGGGDTPIQPDMPELTPKYDGASVFRINVPNDNYEFAINLCNNASTATYDVDWGDGSLESGLTTDEQHHTYSKAGTYDVNVYNISKNITLGGTTTISGSSSVTVYFLFNNTKNDIWLGNKYNYQKDNTTVINILIGNKITKIGSSTFQGCTSLQSIVIPEGVTSIGSNAFYGCTSLQSVTIPNSVTSIGKEAFYQCSSLQSVTIPEGVTSIGSNAFQNCSSLQSVTIPEGVTSIEISVFSYCSSLQSINIPEGVKSIEISAFSYCSSLQSINIPEGVKSIGNSAFSYCSSLQSVTIPNSVTSIGNEVFRSCSSLQSVVIPEGVKSIGDNLFWYCSSLQSVVIPEGVKSIGYYFFGDCSSLQSVTIPNSVTSIRSSAFQSCSSLQSVVISEGVTSIDSSAFQYCNYLQSITCHALTAPTIQTNSFITSSFKYTKRYLYVPKDSVGYDSGNWKTYLIDKGWELRYIEDYPKTPTTLKLKTKNNFFHNLQAIGQANLINYELINDEYIYHFDDKITELTQYTFYDKVLEEIELPEGVEKYVFQNYSSLQSIELPNSVTSIGSSAFSYCSSLTSINIPETVTSIGSSAFSGCSSLTSINIPETVTSIGTFAFSNCSSLQNISIPNGVTSIGQFTFNSCSSLQNISIPNSVTSIGSSAFSYCSSLQTITCLNLTAPKIQSDTFYKISTQVPSGTPKVLRIPQGSSGYEETTSEWYKQLISKGYKFEYIVPNTLNYTSYSGDIVTPYAKSFEGKNEIVSNVYENGIGTLTFKEGLTEIYDSMYNKDVVGELTSIEIPNNITRIGDYSFRSQYLTTLNVPNSVTYIGDSAFNGCTNLTEITLGSGVETIGQWAFSACTKIATITSMAMVAPTFNQSFLSVGLNVSGDKILRVPQGAEGYDTWLSQLNGFELQYIN